MRDSEENIEKARGFDLYGHDAAEKMFLDAYNSDRLHHAWLITGPRGIGKASLAYKVARFLLSNPREDNGLFADALAPSSPTTLATDELSSVNKIISAGSHGDIIVIERQPNEKTGKMKAEIVVDDVRKLQNFFNKTATEGGWRIAIIDSADEMNRNAANAVLKALEEPPKNALLILLAHAPGKLLPTITSRCRQLRLNPLPSETVCAILGQHYPDIGPDDVAGYGVLSDGSPGYAINLVEHQGLELYIQLLEILASLPALDVPMAHKLAGSLSLKAAEPKYILFGELLTAFINRMIRHVSAVQGAVSAGEISPVKPVLTGELDLMLQLGQRIPLDHWAELWEKVTHKMAQVNLDRKQVILNVLTLLSQNIK